MKALLIATSAILALSTACTPDQTTAQRDQERRETATDWRRDRDEYISRMERQLDEMDRNIETATAKAKVESKQAWGTMKERTRQLRTELNEAKTAAEGNWEVAKRRMENAWDALRGDYDRNERGM